MNKSAGFQVRQTGGGHAQPFTSYATLGKQQTHRALLLIRAMRVTPHLAPCTVRVRRGQAGGYVAVPRWHAASAQTLELLWRQRTDLHLQDTFWPHMLPRHAAGLCQQHKSKPHVLKFFW